MLPGNVDLILARLDAQARVLDVGGWAAPFRPATHVLDIEPYETRGVMLPGYGPEPERFGADTWVVRDICDREPWPFEDDFFDFSLCVTTLEDLRDPIWVCSELSRVSKAGYVEVPTIIAELIYSVDGQAPILGHAHHRWFCETERGGLVFTHKPHLIHSNWRLRVLPRWAAQLTVEEQLLDLFWEGELPAREEHIIGPPGYPLERWERLVRERFEPTALELGLKRLRERLGHLVRRSLLPLRRLVERGLGALRR